MILNPKQSCRILSFCGIGLLLFFSVFFQAAAAPYTEVLEATPSVPLVLCVLLSLKLKGGTAITLGLICGVCSDLLSGRTVGYDCLLYVYISAGCVVLASRVYCRSLFIKIAVVCLASLLYGVGVACTRTLFFGVWSFRGLFSHTIYNAAITPILVLLTGRSVKEPF